MNRLSDEAKTKIVQLYLAGESPAIIARRFGVHPKTPRLLASGRSSRGKRSVNQKDLFLESTPAQDREAAAKAWDDMAVRFPPKDAARNGVR